MGSKQGPFSSLALPSRLRIETDSAFSLMQDWKHMHIADILSMPDKWEYPFFGESSFGENFSFLLPFLSRDSR